MKQKITEIHSGLIERSKRGDKRAQHKLYKLYANAILNICYRMVNQREDAEDLLQETFSEAFRHLEQFNYEATFGAWLKRIAINRSINALKRRRIALEYDETLEASLEEPDHIDHENRELSIERVMRALEKIPEGNRLIFSLYLIEGYDHQEISDILEISVSKSKTQLMRAKRKIKALISEGRIA